MQWNIFNHEFRVHLRSIFTWTIAIAAIILIFFAIFPSFSDEADLMNDMMAQFPPELLAAFGMNGMDMASVLGFFSLIFVFVQICLAIQAANYGFGLVSIEENELTADFLLSKPVSRLQIMNSKLLAALAAILISTIVTWLSSLLAVALFAGAHEYDSHLMLLVMASVLPFQLYFLAVGMLVSLLVKRVRSVTPFALGLGFGMYALSAFTDIGDVSVLELITPFKYFNINDIIRTGSLDAALVALSLVITVVAIAASYWLYLRRDIHAVV